MKEDNDKKTNKGILKAKNNKRNSGKTILKTSRKKSALDNAEISKDKNEDGSKLEKRVTMAAKSEHLYESTKSHSSDKAASKIYKKVKQGIRVLNKALLSTLYRVKYLEDWNSY